MLGPLDALGSLGPHLQIGRKQELLQHEVHDHKDGELDQDRPVDIDDGRGFFFTTSGGGMYHGGNVGATGADYKTVLNASAFSAAATTMPAVAMLIDVLAFIRVTGVTTTTAQTVINSNTFTASSSSGLLLTYTNDFQNLSKVRFTNSGGALPTGLSAGTDYWLIRVSATTARVATTYANAIAATAIAFTDAGTGTHTMTMRLPRYSDGAGVQAYFFNSNATALGAGTPNLTLPSYTNAAGTASRATPSTPVGIWSSFAVTKPSSRPS